MRILVLGGTAWLGRQVAQAGLDAGHEVTCLARGTTGPAPAAAEHVVADRDLPGSSDAVLDRTWDLVVDVSRQPGQVRRAVAALADRSGCFAFVSTGNVYADHREVGQDESAPLLAPLAADEMASMDDYGPAKVACEQAVLDGYGPDRSLVARAGLIGGPGDASGRTGYWPWRFSHPAAADGGVLVPEEPGEWASVIDVRDLASWLIQAGTSGVRGTFDATGDPLPLDRHLQVARDVAGHTGPVVGAGGDWLLAHGVQPWSGPRSLPLWLGDPDWRGFTARDSRRARAAGLAPRPLPETLADALAWEEDRRTAGVRAGWPAPEAGLSDEDELALLRDLGPGPSGRR